MLATIFSHSFYVSFLFQGPPFRVDIGNCIVEDVWEVFIFSVPMRGGVGVGERSGQALSSVTKRLV